MGKQSIQTGNRETLFIPHFKQMIASFASSIEGIADEAMLQNYASLVLDRLLVLFFLQQHGLLNNNIRYLQHHLAMIHAAQSDTFFAAFFLPLCHTTFCGQNTSGTQFGHIPILAHPLFQQHPIEATYQPQIPDESFHKLFLFLQEYCWELKPSPVGTMPCAGLLTCVQECNRGPEARQAGGQGKQAPYSKASFTIGTGQGQALPLRRNLVPTPCTDPTSCACSVVHHDIFADLLEQRINQKQTGTYYTTKDVTGYVANNTILPALFHRLQRRCPAIMDPCSAIWQYLMHRPERYIPAALQHSAYLPRETPQEYQSRQQRFSNVMMLLQQGRIRSMDAMITYNLDVLRLAVDMISAHEDLELLAGLFTELEQLTILDPTCGSGAFLCEALATLQTLYMACLQRMQDLVGTVGTGESPVPTGLIEAVMQQISAAPNISFFVVHHIITHNLYGLDLMDEATSVCTLRLYLTLLAQTQRIEDVLSFSQVPMHIKTGNALVGDVYSTVFPEVTQLGGFAVILGNPPYIEHSKVRDQYPIAGHGEKSCGNLYAAMLQRSLALLHPEASYIGLLLPMSICSGQRFSRLRTLLMQALSPLWLANFDIFPCRLFGNAFQRLSILLGRHKAQFLREEDSRNEEQPLQIGLYTTHVHRWYPEERPFLIDLLKYTPCCQPHTSLQQLLVFPKLASTLHTQILQKVVTKADGHTIAAAQQRRQTPYFVYYQEATNYWIKAVCHIPFYKKNGTTMTPPHGRFLFFGDEWTARIIMALMNSSLFYLWFTTYGDGFHLAHAVVTSFPYEMGGPPSDLASIAYLLEADLLAHTRLSTRNTRFTGDDRSQDRHAIELTEYQASYSKGIIDEIDRLLADYYDFTEEEFHFITEYDKKYRMGQVEDNIPK